MIEIKPTAFYTHDDLRKMFSESHLDWEWLREVIHPRRVIGKAYWGAHIISAIDAAMDTKARRHGWDEDRAEVPPVPPAKRPRVRRTALDDVLAARK